MSNARVIKPPTKPKYCLFIPWTRLTFADRMLHNLNDLMLPREEMEVVFYVDTDDKALFKRLNDWCVLNQFVYNGMTIVVSGNGPPEGYSPLPRRARIVAMKEDSKQYISATDYVFGIEDDTRVPTRAFEYLFEHFTRNPAIGFVQGVQQGRWGLAVLGAWQVDNLDNPQRVWTQPFDTQGQESVDVVGGGFFCYITPVKLYKEHQYHWYDECFSVDMTYGYELAKKGYRNITDFRVICDHMTDQGVLMPTPHNTISVEWNKQGERWIQMAAPVYAFPNAAPYIS